MNTNIFNTNARAMYLTALAHWKGSEELEASVALNATRDILLEGQHSTKFSDEHTRQIMSDLTVHEFMGLYGDPAEKGKKAHSDWVQDEKLSAKANRHYEVLNNVITPQNIWNATQEYETRSLSVA